MRLLLCDARRLYAEPLAAALRQRDHEVLLATSPPEALELLDRHAVDVCVTDLRFPELGGAAAVTALRRSRSGCPVVVLTGSTDLRDREAAMAAGAAAYVTKDLPMAAIFEILGRVAAGQQVPPARRRLPRPAAPAHDGYYRGPGIVEPLTRRERQVLRRLVEAEDTEQIARSLGVAPSTVRTHLQSLFVKMGVSTRLQAVAVAAERGLVVEPVGRAPTARG